MRKIWAFSLFFILINITYKGYAQTSGITYLIKTESKMDNKAKPSVFFYLLRLNKGSLDNVKVGKVIMKGGFKIDSVCDKKYFYKNINDSNSHYQMNTYGANYNYFNNFKTELHSVKWYKKRNLLYKDVIGDTHNIYTKDKHHKMQLISNEKNLVRQEFDRIPGYIEYERTSAFIISKSQYDSIYMAWDGNKIKLDSSKKPPFHIQSTETTKSIKAKNFMILEYFFIGCYPCHKSLPNIELLFRQVDTSKVYFAGVNYVDKPENLVYFKIKNKIKYDVYGKNDKIPKKLFPAKIKVYPTVLLLDKRGVILNKWVGEITDEKLDEIIKVIQENGLMKG